MEQRAEKKTLSPAEAEAFVRGVSYEIGGKPILSSCVDGRYPAAEAEAAPLARPGADAGDMLIALAALRRLQMENGGSVNVDALRPLAIQAAVEAAGGPEKFRFHTDNRAGAEVARGCGHLAQAEKDPQAYGLTPEDMRAVFDALEGLKRAGAKETVLSGAHAEGAVFVVKDKNLGLRRAENGNQSFVFHEALHRERLEELAKRLIAAPGFKNAGVSEKKLAEALLASSESQTAETLRRLAQGLPVYAVNGNGMVGV